MTNPELLPLEPCPFCGGEAIIQDLDNGCDVFVHCKIGGCCQLQDVFDSDEKAIKAWNQRSPIPTQKLEEEIAQIMLEIVHTQRKDESAEDCCRRASKAICSHFSLPRVVSVDEIEKVFSNSYFDKSLTSRQVAQVIHTALYGEEKG